MPTYDYLCNECGHRFEEFQSIMADPLEVCPKCNGKVRRLISSGNGLIFKGSGFYITDYKNSSSHSDKKPSEKATEDSSSASGTKKETPKKTKTDSD